MLAKLPQLGNERGARNTEVIPNQITSGRVRRKRARPCVFFVSDISVLEVRRGEDS